MLRMATMAVFIFSNTAAFAQMDALKDIKFGVGCVGPVSTFAKGLGTCVVDGSKSRIWCPNGKIFDRGAEWPRSSYVVRAICGLNQV